MNNGFLIRTQVVRYCSKPYLCIILLVAILAVCVLGYGTYQIYMRNLSNQSFIPIMYGGPLFFSATLLMVPRASLDIIKAFYTGRINVSKLKENPLLRFICSDDFFLGLSKNSKLSLDDKIIDIITILIYILVFILIFFYCPMASK